MGKQEADSMVRKLGEKNFSGSYGLKEFSRKETAGPTEKVLEFQVWRNMEGRKVSRK